MKLTTYIKEVGDKRAAENFGVKERRVKSWRLRERFPSRAVAMLIVQRTDGLVTLDEIYAANDDH